VSPWAQEEVLTQQGKWVTLHYTEIPPNCLFPVQIFDGNVDTKPFGNSKTGNFEIVVPSSEQYSRSDLWLLRMKVLQLLLLLQLLSKCHGVLDANSTFKRYVKLAPSAHDGRRSNESWGQALYPMDRRFSNETSIAADLPSPRKVND
jgi:hypothetical protein